MKTKLNHLVLWPPLFMLFGMTALNFISEDAFAAIMNGSFSWVAENMAWFFQLTCFSCVIILLLAALQKCGNIRLGGPEAKPDFGTWTWFSMILCGGIGVGIVLWGAAEPIFNLAEPPLAAGVEAFSEGAAVWSLSQSFLHWGLTPYALYGVFALAIGLAHYNYGQPLRASSGFHFIWGDRRPESFNSLVDMFAVISLSCGLAVSMGLGVLQIARGLETVFGLNPSRMIWTLIVLFITASYTLSSYVGLDKSLKFIARYNTNIFIGLLIFLLIVGPTAFNLNLGVESLGLYLSDFIRKSLWTSPIAKDSYLIWFDLNYWANWCAYAPIMGFFLVRISYGRTVRQFISANLVAPAAFGMIWFTIFGGTAIKYQLDGVVDLWAAIGTKGLEATVFTFFETLPLGGLLAPFFILVVILSFVTLADPMTSAIASLSCRNDDPAYDGEPPKGLKFFWGLGVGGIALVMILFAGFNGPRMFSVIMGVPSMIMCFLLLISLVKGVWFPGDQWLPSKVGLMQPSKETYIKHHMEMEVVSAAGTPGGSPHIE